MAKYVFLVMTNPTSPEQEAEYNRWYGTDHYRDVLGVPGFVAWPPALDPLHRRGVLLPQQHVERV